MRFLQGEEFLLSLRELFQKGGKYQKAAQTVQAIWGRAKLEPASLAETFKGVSTTNHGEDRIPHCVKYDLTGFARLVVVVNNNICVFLFAGDHDVVDRWLNRNKGLNFVAKHQVQGVVLNKIRTSDASQGNVGFISSESDLGTGPLLKLLPERYQKRVLQNLDAAIVSSLYQIESIADDDLIFELCTQCGDLNHQAAMLDVLLSLRSGDVANAKGHVDVYANESTPVNELEAIDIDALRSSESAVLLSDIDQEIFQHFVETASFEKWMLYLHPSQRLLVDRDFKGAARMAGVSGSGKTSVVIHRALRMAEKYSSEPVLVVTLSAALASLINQLIDAQRGGGRPKNLKVTSIFDLCFEKLVQLEPDRSLYYTKQSIARNIHAVSEHFDDVWHEFYMCENNNHDADVLLDVAQSLNARAIFANDYLRQEFDYIRSSFSPQERSSYLTMERQGRIVPLDEKFRQKILDGLSAWERKMDAVGVIDDMGIVAALYRHLDAVTPEYRAILVDEAQDLGTLELAIIRKLVSENENDLFFCGDAAQTIYTKSADYKLAGIDATGRHVRLNQNYRNSRQILTAAHTVLSRSLDAMPKGAMSLDVLPPEYASFSSPKPLLLEAFSFKEEIERGMSFLNACIAGGQSTQKYCLAICGYSGASIESLGKQLSLPTLIAGANLNAGQIFLSDLEQTKGFEFDAVVLINCTQGVLPHPNLPSEESFRDLCRLYVAMTRAKTQLVVSYTKTVSPFVAVARDEFISALFSDYADQEISIDPISLKQSIPALSLDSLDSAGKIFLKSRNAIGLDKTAQEEILAHVTGIDRLRGVERKQLEWKTLGAFLKSMENPRERHQIISDEAWQNLRFHLAAIDTLQKA